MCIERSNIPFLNPAFLVDGSCPLAAVFSIFFTRSWIAPSRHDAPSRSPDDSSSVSWSWHVEGKERIFFSRPRLPFFIVSPRWPRSLDAAFPWMSRWKGGRKRGKNREDGIFFPFPRKVVAPWRGMRARNHHEWCWARTGASGVALASPRLGPKRNHHHPAPRPAVSTTLIGHGVVTVAEPANLLPRAFFFLLFLFLFNIFLNYASKRVFRTVENYRFEKLLKKIGKSWRESLSSVEGIYRARRRPSRRLKRIPLSFSIIFSRAKISLISFLTIQVRIQISSVNF